MTEISFGTFEEIPSRSRIGGGRKSELLDAVRNGLDQPGKMASIPLEFKEQEDGTEETVQSASQRMQSRFNRKDALPFAIRMRTNNENRTLDIYRVAEQTETN